ncbi:PspA/IM30 family protein [Jeotgalibacillus sp. R-1-5s-1]|uniref:PspA/IM30 family protein n=1 Tax=Jeotgalibacillus sp. R-1-5s-1 TaxID=2555897 RepID=UPI00106C0D92|nr:PspA/IM30 family protein [Jeotgalibacillus sp. R-1-5s-1]TFE01197.1 hypothetical protein E2491_04080 [Jeotgalibacillus sp. R-1-5s-1]
MNHVLTKIAEVIKQDFQDAKWKKEMSNPLTALSKEIKDCEAAVKRAQQLTDRQKLLKKEFEKEFREAKSMAEKRKEHVKLAEEAGKEELAAAALREYTYYSGRTERLEITIREAEAQLKDLEHQQEQITFKLKDLQLKRLEYMAKENAVKGEKQASFMLNPEQVTDEDRRFMQIDQYLKSEEKKKEVLTIDEQIEELKHEN